MKESYKNILIEEIRNKVYHGMDESMDDGFIYFDMPTNGIDIEDLKHRLSLTSLDLRPESGYLVGKIEHEYPIFIDWFLDNKITKKEFLHFCESTFYFSGPFIMSDKFNELLDLKDSNMEELIMWRMANG